MSLFTRLWQRLRAPTRYIGRDLEGNKFYEHPSSSSDPRRTKRTVQYLDPELYIGGGRKLPVQWSAWMTHTRHHPPTPQELQIDLARQQRVQANVALIEARDQEERARVLRLNAAGPTVPLSNATIPEAKSLLLNEPQAPLANSESPSSEPARQSNPWKNIPSSSEPQSWDPRARKRRSES